jgi:hypothetical protein
MQNNIRTVYISEIHLLYNLSTIFGVLYQNMNLLFYSNTDVNVRLRSVLINY